MVRPRSLLRLSWPGGLQDSQPQHVHAPTAQPRLHGRVEDADLIVDSPLLENPVEVPQDNAPLPYFKQLHEQHGPLRDHRRARVHGKEGAQKQFNAPHKALKRAI